jgi:hypothetical protein
VNFTWQTITGLTQWRLLISAAVSPWSQSFRRQVSKKGRIFSIDKVYFVLAPSDRLGQRKEITLIAFNLRTKRRDHESAPFKQAVKVIR